MSFKNCLKRVSELPVAVSTRLNYLDGNKRKKRLENKVVSCSAVECGAEVEIFSICGPGAIRTVFMELKGRLNAEVEKSCISIYVDGEQKPSVSGNLRDFFLSGLEGRCIYGDYAGKTGASLNEPYAAYYRYLFVPYSCKCRITITASCGDIIKVNAHIYYQKDILGEMTDFGKYNKAFSAERKGREMNYSSAVVLADIKGNGLIHSFQFSMRNSETRGEYMEGNIEIYLDGESFPSYQTTGTEEFFMGGVYFISMHETAYSGCTRTFNDGFDNPDNICSAHRLFIDDPICFSKEIKIVWHNGEMGQGQVKGITEYEFHCIYYLDSTPINSRYAIPYAEAKCRLDCIDNDKDNKFTHYKNFNVRLNNESIELVNLSGPAQASLIHLKLDGNSKDAELEFKIDNKKYERVPLNLFFYNSSISSYVGSTAGHAGDGTFFRYVNIPFQEHLSITLYSAEEISASGHIEYKKSMSDKYNEYNSFFIGGCRKMAQENQQCVLAEMHGEGNINDIVLDVRADNEASGEIFIYCDDDSIPAVISWSLPEFFLSSASNESSIAGAAATVGILSRGQRFTAFRVFLDDAITFKRFAKIVLNPKNDQELLSCITASLYGKLYCEDGMQKTINKLVERINILDVGAQEQYGMCYSSMECVRGAIESGGSNVLFEDFGSGAIRCIRLGSPMYASALVNSRIRMYIDGEQNCAIDTTVERFFSAALEASIFWYNCRYMAKPSQIMREEPCLNHVSCYRYIHIPYSKGIKIVLTCSEDNNLLGFSQVYYQGGTAADLNFGRHGYLQNLSCTELVKPGAVHKLAELNGRGWMESFQVILDNETDADYLNGMLTIFIDGNILIECPLKDFFLVSPYKINSNLFDSYTQTWKDERKRCYGKATGTYAGVPVSRDEAPYKYAAYRLFVVDPVCFNKSIKILWKNSAANCTQLKSDIILGTDKILKETSECHI